MSATATPPAAPAKQTVPAVTVGQQVKYIKRPDITDTLFFGVVSKVYGDAEGNIDITFRNGAGTGTKIPFDGTEKAPRSWSTNLPKKG